MKKYLQQNLFIFFLCILSGPSLLAQRWERVNPPAMPAAFNNEYWLDVFFLPSDPNYGWACGQFDASVIRTTNGGQTWLGTTVPTGTGRHLESIHFASKTVGYTSGPAGVFKSTDGGASWFDVTPASAGQRVWGCYFLSENLGVAVGDGCSANGPQRFFKTTDGGASWTEFNATEPQTGLTDALLYADGSGFAVSSGRLWSTTDFGSTWSIFAQTGSKVWQEEITKVGNSFLLPYAGTTCGGGGNAGGMRFSVDNGANWREYSTGNNMFGTFLLNPQTGWACGYNNSVYYTENGGQSWEIRNCGATGFHDDIWFIDDDSGWLAGSGGLFRYAPPVRTVSRTNVSFGEFCIPDVRQDTVWVKNISFKPVNVNYSISGVGASDFTVIQPSSTNFTINPCDSVRLVVRLRPTSPGSKILQVKLTFPDTPEIYVSFSAQAVSQESFPVDTLLIINPARAGVITGGSITFNNPSEETFSNIGGAIRTAGSPQILTGTVFPVPIPSSGGLLNFIAQPTDTGWVTARFRVTLNPCAKDTFVTVRAYGVSPIITGPVERHYSTACSPNLQDTLVISNTGNDTLKIPSAPTMTGDKDFSFLGWLSAKPYPRYILPGKSDTVIISFTPLSLANKTARLLIQNNDLTTVRGPKNPFGISLFGSSDKPRVTRSTGGELQFGEICVGQSATGKIALANQGNILAAVTGSGKTGLFTFRLSTGRSTLAAAERDSALISFTPGSAGEFSDTILIVVNPCADTIRVPVFGRAISTGLSAVPVLLQDEIPTGTATRKTVYFKSTGPQAVRISPADISLNPARSDWRIVSLPSKDTVLKAGDSIAIEIEFTPGTDTSYAGRLCVTASIPCPAEACAVIDLKSSSKSLVISKAELLYSVRCDTDRKADTVILENIGGAPVQVKNISLARGLHFSISEPAAKSFSLAPKAVSRIVLVFTAPSEGQFRDTLLIETGEASNPLKLIPLTGVWETTRSSVSRNRSDFGILEICDQPVYDTIQVANSGLLDDTLVVQRRTLAPGFTVEPGDTLILPSGEMRILIIGFSPQKGTSGENRDTVTLFSLVCGKTIPVPIAIHANLIRPQLTIEPSQIDFGSVMEDFSRDSAIVITNNSGYDVELTGLDFDPPVDVFTAAFSGRVLRTGESVTVPLKFSALREGNFTSRILLKQKTRCEFMDTVGLLAVVPHESYPVRLRMNDYVTAASLTVMVPVTVEETVDRADISRITLGIEFNPNLVTSVVNIFSADNTGRKIPYTQQPGRIEVSLDREMRGRDLDSAGDLFVMEMLTTIWNPKETPLVFKDVNIESRRETVPVTRNGKIQAGYCPPIWGIQSLPGFSSGIIAGQGSGEIALRLNASAEQEIELSLVDLTGVERLDRSFFVSPGEQDLVLRPDELPAGVYFLILKNSFGIAERHKIVIAR